MATTRQLTPEEILAMADGVRTSVNTAGSAAASAAADAAAKPAAPATPAPAAPTVAPQPTPEQRVKSDLDAGTAWAKDQIKDGSLGRLNDQYKGQADELLSMQKAGLQGLTPEEMRAAREQGNAQINRSLSGNLRQLGGIAAANGVRGGAAAGLQQGAINQATMAQGDLQRKLVLDNINQKNIAMDRYGNTLGNQQGVGLGVDKFNLDQGNREQLGRLGLGMQYGGLIDSYRAGDKADEFSKRGIDLSEKALDAMTKGAGPAAAAGSPGTMSPADARASFINDPANGNLSEQAINTYLDRPENKFAQSKGYATWAELPDPLKRSPEGMQALGAPASGNLGEKPIFSNPGEEKVFNNRLPTNATPEQRAQAIALWNEDKLKNPAPFGIGPDGKPNQEGCAPGVHCYVMTVATGMGLLDRDYYAATVSDCPTRKTNIRAYGVWGPLVAKLMQRSPAFARFVAWVTPETVKVLRGQPAAFRGLATYHLLYVPFSWAANLYLKLKEAA